MLTIIALDSTWKDVKELAAAAGVDGSVFVFTQDAAIAAELKACGVSAVEKIPERSEVVIAGLDPAAREKAWKEMQGHPFATLIHPDHFLHTSVRIGAGCLVFRGVIGYPEGVVGNNCVLMEYASVSHNSAVGDHSVFMEKVTMGGWSAVGERTLLKPNCVTKEKITLGDDVTAECGSVIMNDIPDGQSIAGNPARMKRKHIAQ